MGMVAKKHSINAQEIMQEAIIALLYRYEELTAKEIQQRLQLKRQTVYNYLNEMEENNIIISRVEKHPEHNNVRLTYYKLSKKNPQPEEYQTALGKTFYLENPISESRKMMMTMINRSIGVLLEAKSFIEDMDDKELRSYLLRHPEYAGPGIDLILMNEKEYTLFSERINTMMRDTWKELSTLEQSNNRNQYMAILGGFFPFDK